MKLYLTAILGIIFFLFSQSCKKKDELPASSKCNITKAYLYSDAFSNIYIYDNEGKLTGLTETFGNSTIINQFVYNDKKQIIKSARYSPSDIGSVDSTWYFYNQDNNICLKVKIDHGQNFSMNTYIYNQKKQIVIDSIGNESYRRYEYDGNGNISKIFVTGGSEQPEFVEQENISYDNRKNLLTFDTNLLIIIGNEDYSNNNVIKRKYFDPNGGAIEEEDYSYNYNFHNYPNKVMINFKELNKLGDITDTSYSEYNVDYNCK